MKRMMRALVAGGVAVAGLAGATALPAHAAPSGTGFNDSPDHVTGGGSDTTLRVITALQDLYNLSPGCAVYTAAPPPAGQPLNTCNATQVPEVDIRGNYDHDVVSQAGASGSGAGIAALISATTATGDYYNPPIQFARSSRQPTAAELTKVTGWAYGKDAIQIITFGATGAFPGRPAGNFANPIDIYNVFNCTTTDFSAIPGYTGPAGTIKPFGMQTSSGTYATFRDYLRGVSGNAAFDPNTCGAKLPNGQFPFENDVKPILAGPDGVLGTPDDPDPTNFIWWGSNAELSSYSYKRQTSQFWTVGGVAPGLGTIFDGTYPILRFIWHVTLKPDADLGVGVITPPGQNSDVDIAQNNLGGTLPSPFTAGQSGAVREFTRFLCRTSNAQYTLPSPNGAAGLDPATGLGYRTELNNTITGNGFQVVPPADRTAGYACKVLNA